ncbi:hypothetical protein B0181_07955 [Moraxella caviae]|uniref:Uncharacterized protein n=1 Tax=Moraxella caviae TaxID=34060 RepID=A0A1T0A0B6_9GAMM|nr:hypothetical protein [Moraxella caviae]OOR88641.1 hypothetical protein B0181_07955 [Moraxella caviae]STZ13675.1 Uncharacterised protein [Moraxella caviae]
MRHGHWSQSSREFTIFGLPAGPCILSIVFILIATRGFPLFWYIMFGMWAYYIVFVFILKIRPRYSIHLMRTWLVGKDRNAKNENSYLQY